MEQNCRRDLERTQYEVLCALSEYIYERSYERNPSILDDTKLETLGVTRRANLDVDSQCPCDFEPRFFSPCYDKDSGLEEEADRARRVWHETLDDRKHLDPEWVQNAGYMYSRMRAEWFDDILTNFGYHYGDEIHPMCVLFFPSLFPTSLLTQQASNNYGAQDQEDMDFAAPIGNDFSDTMYITNYYQVPTTTDKPHMGIVMLDPTVAPEGKMLWSELEAAVTLLREQVRSGRFTNHHTKPVSPPIQRHLSALLPPRLPPIPQPTDTLSHHHHANATTPSQHTGPHLHLPMGNPRPPHAGPPRRQDEQDRHPPVAPARPARQGTPARRPPPATLAAQLARRRDPVRRRPCRGRC